MLEVPMSSVEEMQRAWEVRINEQSADVAICQAIIETLLVNMLSSKPNGSLLLQETQQQVLALLSAGIADAKFLGVATLRAQGWFQAMAKRLSQTSGSSQH